MASRFAAALCSSVVPTMAVYYHCTMYAGPMDSASELAIHRMPRLSLRVRECLRTPPDKFPHQFFSGRLRCTFPFSLSLSLSAQLRSVSNIIFDGFIEFVRFVPLYRAVGIYLGRFLKRNRFHTG